MLKVLLGMILTVQEPFLTKAITQQSCGDGQLFVLEALCLVKGSTDMKEDSQTSSTLCLVPDNSILTVTFK